MASKKIPFRAFVFVLVFIVIFAALNWVFADDFPVSSVWEDVQVKNSTSDILIMGNSHAYTSLNAYTLSDALDADILLLGSSRQPVSMAYDNLQVVLKTHKPKIILLEIFCAVDEQKALDVIRQSENKFSVYRNSDGMDSFIDKFDSLYKFVELKDIPDGLFNLFRSGNMWSRLKNNRIIGSRERQDIKGYIYSTNSKYMVESNDYMAEAVNQYTKCKENIDESLLSEDTASVLRSFFSLCNENDIEVWLYGAPLANYYPGYLSQAMCIKKLGEEYGVKYFDEFGDKLLDIGLNTEDFYDAGHLNRRGAAKFTEYYANIIAERLNKTVDFEKSFFYKSESLEQLENGKTRCTIDLYGDRGAWFKFVETYDGEKVSETDWAHESFFDTALDVTDSKTTITVYVLPYSSNPSDPDTDIEDALEYDFMKVSSAKLS